MRFAGLGNPSSLGGSRCPPGRNSYKTGINIGLARLSSLEWPKVGRRAAKQHLIKKAKGIYSHLNDIIWLDYLTSNFGSLSRGKTHSSDLNLCISFFYFRTESQQEPRNKVALLSPTERPEKRNLLDPRPRRRPLTKTKSYVQFNGNFKAFSENTKALSISDLRIQFFPLNKNFINITKRLSLKPHTTSNTMDIEQITSAFNNHVNVKKIREVFHEVS